MVYAYFYYQPGDYVAVHGTRTNGFVALTAVSGQGAGYAVRRGKQAAPAGAWGANPKLPITGFNGITCWHGWVVANVLADANGMVVFSEHAGLHMLSKAEFSKFNSEVCSSARAPASWKSPEAGPAICR